MPLGAVDQPLEPVRLGHRVVVQKRDVISARVDRVPDAEVDRAGEAVV
jgi:hypothetical protein